MCDKECSECEWKKADPKQLAKTLQQMKSDIQKAAQEIKKLRYDVNDLKIWKETVPANTPSYDFCDDQPPF